MSEQKSLLIQCRERVAYHLEMLNKSEAGYRLAQDSVAEAAETFEEDDPRLETVMQAAQTLGDFASSRVFFHWDEIAEAAAEAKEFNDNTRETHAVAAAEQELEKPIDGIPEEHATPQRTSRTGTKTQEQQDEQQQPDDE